MKNQQEVKDEVARKHGFAGWWGVTHSFKHNRGVNFARMTGLENEAMEAYAKQFQEQRVCAENNYMVNKVYEELRENFVDENAFHAPSYIRGLQDMRDKMKEGSK